MKTVPLGTRLFELTPGFDVAEPVSGSRCCQNPVTPQTGAGSNTIDTVTYRHREDEEMQTYRIFCKPLGFIDSDPNNVLQIGI
ncbi:hypothetical protein J6590_086247 [Homalodisca vitripennis]|nr:hypothetical protein J6590_086247 [Homalodisca vitripennis]